MTRSRRLHPAWIVLGALTLCLLASTGIRAVFGVYIKPMENELGWTRGALSMAAALSLLLLGAVGPFAGRLADRWGPRRVIVLALPLARRRPARARRADRRLARPQHARGDGTSAARRRGSHAVGGANRRRAAGRARVGGRGRADDAVLAVDGHV